MITHSRKETLSILSRLIPDFWSTLLSIFQLWPNFLSNLLWRLYYLQWSLELDSLVVCLSCWSFYLFKAWVQNYQRNIKNSSWRQKMNEWIKQLRLSIIFYWSNLILGLTDLSKLSTMLEKRKRNGFLYDIGFQCGITLFIILCIQYLYLQSIRFQSYF